LPKITDPDTGKKRHQTPREALQWHKDHGWQGFMLDEQGIIDAFRPHVVKKVTRDTVTPWGGMRYANHEVLPHWNGKEVMVAFDTDDNSKVWVKDLKGLLLCEAKLVNAVPYLSPNFQQMAEEKRLKQQLKALDQKRETKLARHGGDVIEGEALIRVPHLPNEALEPIELKRVEFDGESAPTEPLKVLVVDVEDRPEDKPLSFVETIMKFQADGNHASGNE
jgi:putative transposase